jgi:hypothetical protein
MLAMSTTGDGVMLPQGAPVNQYLGSCGQSVSMPWVFFGLDGDEWLAAEMYSWVAIESRMSDGLWVTRDAVGRGV